MTVSVILMDIEGTTTAIDFVHKVLFPYSRENMGPFLDKHAAEPAVQTCLKDVQATVKEEESRVITETKARDVLLGWIAADRKHPALKKLQGMIWKDGYLTGAYTAHLYDDVLPKLKQWNEAGKTLAIYSSGSIQAQKLLFAHTVAGDVTHLLSHYFDTSSGHKREQESYHSITKDLGVAADEILFLSDVVEELDAAKAAGLQTIQLVRPGTAAGERHATVASFAEIA